MINNIQDSFENRFASRVISSDLWKIEKPSDDNPKKHASIDNTKGIGEIKVECIFS
uniref:hypothetical protein n=1 Tax=Acetivibrio cellulolyticus TaxID=35830 RepID=UPI001F1C1221|nr:hypothetical protein [Acetivibrio cellulolyticus]